MKNKKSLIIAGVLIVLLAGGQILLKKSSSGADNNGNIEGSVKTGVSFHGRHNRAKSKRFECNFLWFRLSSL